MRGTWEMGSFVAFSAKLSPEQTLTLSMIWLCLKICQITSFAAHPLCTVHWPPSVEFEPHISRARNVTSPETGCPGFEPVTGREALGAKKRLTWTVKQRQPGAPVRASSSGWLTPLSGVLFKSSYLLLLMFSIVFSISSFPRGIWGPIYVPAASLSTVGCCCRWEHVLHTGLSCLRVRVPMP